MIRVSQWVHKNLDGYGKKNFLMHLFIIISIIIIIIVIIIIII